MRAKSGCYGELCATGCTIHRISLRHELYMIKHQSVQPNDRWLVHVERSVRMRAGGMLIAGVVATAMILLWHPVSWLPECPFHRATGLYCPGCGSVRATHHILNGRFELGIKHNLMLLLLGVPLAVWFWSEQIVMVTIGRRFRPLFGKPMVAWVALSALLGFAVVRNLPGEAFDVLRPPEESTAQTMTP